MILQRMKGVLDSMKRINFDILDSSQTYCNQEEILVMEEEDKVIVSFTIQLPNPGYFAEVYNIRKEGSRYRIYLDIKPPEQGMMQLQIIAYMTIKLQVQKSRRFQPPYKFLIESSITRLL